MNYKPTTQTLTIYSAYGDNCKLKLYQGTAYLGTFYVLTADDNPSDLPYMYSCYYSTNTTGNVVYTYRIYNSNNVLVEENTKTNYNCCFPMKPYLSNPVEVNGYIRFTINYG
jgi:hypothetical protein